MLSKEEPFDLKRLSIEDLKEEDIQDVVNIEKKSFPEPWSPGQFEKELVSNISHYYKAVYDGRLVGYAGILFIADEAHITTIAVEEKMRRHGIGRLLMCKLLNVAVEKKASAVTLEVRVSNADARKLYRRFGFAIVGERKGYYSRVGEDAYVMDSPYIQSETYLKRLKDIGC